MGCCVSADKATSPTPKGLPMKQQLSTHHDHHRHHEEISSRAPPPSIEEETVKEVLSETPKPNNVDPQPIKYPSPEPPKYQITTITTNNTTKLSHVENVDLNPTEPSFSFQDDLQDDVVSEQARSELSSSTITNDYSYEEEREAKARRARSSPVATSKLNQRTRPVGNFAPGRDRVVGKSPTRRSNQSPVKRVNNASSAGGGSGPVRVVQSREQVSVSGPGVARRGLRYEPNRRDPVPGSGGGPTERRSRSPATNRSVVGRSPSNNRRTSRSPGRARADPSENGAGNKVEENGVGGNKWPSSNSPTNGNNGESNANESLENPLVSLECFIFL